MSLAPWQQNCLQNRKRLCIKMSKYNANVRIGNWYYDLIFQEEKTKQYMRRTRNADLKVQKTRRVFLSLLKEVPLTFPVVGLSYGAVIQIVSPDTPFVSRYKIPEKQGIALAADIDFKNVDERCTFAPGDPIIGTGLLTPCARNVWTLEPDEKSKKGKELRFGDSFHIRLASSETPLYIEAPTYSPSVPKGESGHVIPKLIGWTTTLTRFKVVNIIPKMRYETEGTVVPPFERIALIQGANSASLALEESTLIPTFFGMECEVSVFTFKDNKDPNKPDPRNNWCFILSSA